MANSDKQNESPIIGIDLGTTYSCVAISQLQHVELIPNDQGNRMTPSFVAFTKTECLVGEAAQNQAAANPNNTVFDTKRLIGRKFNDEAVQKDVKGWPFKVVPGLGSQNKEKPMISVSYKGEKAEFTAEEISAKILTKMKQVTETYLGKLVTNAVITVPAYFNNVQRQTMKDAGLLAGLNVMRILDEPTAAIIAYGIDKLDVKKNVLVFNLGGRTCDITLIVVERDVFKVKSMSVDAHLGGQDFTNKLVSHFVAEFQKKYLINITENARAMDRLRASCERAKKILSSKSEAPIQIDCFYEGIDLYSSISRALFEMLNMELFHKCDSLVDTCLKGAKMGENDVDEVILVGGSSRIPKIQQMLGEFFVGRDLRKSIDADHVVASGAAIYAASLKPDTDTAETSNVSLLLKDVDSLLKELSEPEPDEPFPSHIKESVLRLLGQLKLNNTDTALARDISGLLRETEFSLPLHLRQAVIGLDQALIESQLRLLKFTAKKEATQIDPNEVVILNTELVRSKKIIQKTSLFSNKLKAEIEDINQQIACLTGQRESLKCDLEFAEQHMVKLTATLVPQMESAKKRLDLVSSFREAEKLETEARHSLSVSIHSICRFLESL